MSIPCYEPPTLASDKRGVLRCKIARFFAPVVCLFKGHKIFVTRTIVNGYAGRQTVSSSWRCARHCGYKS